MSDFAIWDEAGVEVTPEDATFAVPCTTCGEWDSKHNTINLAKRCLEEGISGDFVECGVNAGGHPAMMAWTLQRYGTAADANRKVHLFDSFAGQPQAGPDDCKDYQEQLGLNVNRTKGIASGIFIAYRWQVEENMLKWHVPRDRLVYHEGWLQEVLPPLAETFPPIALLRVDVDLHDSTTPVFEYLYDKVSPGGYIISDDWGSEPLDIESVAGCRKATLDFFKRRGLPAPTVTKLPNTTTTVWWRKP